MNTVQTIIERLIRALATDNERVYTAAIETLADLGATAVPALIDATHSSDRRIRLGAIAAIGIIGREAHSAQRVLVRLQNDPDDEVAEAATLALESVTAGTAHVDAA